MKKISTIFIIIGLLIIAYPFLDRTYTKYMQKLVFNEWNESMPVYDIQPDTGAAEDYMALQEVFDDTAETSPTVVEISPTPTPEIAIPTPTPTKAQEIGPKKPIGILKIDKINLNLPIMDGATVENMKIGAARIKETSNIGEIGNAALAGHRSQTYGRFFNRLDELEKGDEIIIETESLTYKYVIYEKIIVEPSDVSVLNRNKRDKILTLVTCHPIINSTHRLIIHAILK